MEPLRKVRYPWPPVDAEIQEAVRRQLTISTSIYGRDGIVEEFENKFARLHGCEYALLTSSGTAALHSAYYALGIGPGDEVLCPAYTFFATAMPLFQLGALPVLVDCTPEAQLDLDEARQLITDRTKALVITHMWGFPSPSTMYRKFCAENGLAYVEDCSHAHGASFGQTPVGSSADVAIWSLQAGKLVPAGEGGILCTNDEDIYSRATLLGHFNKRAMLEVPPDNPLHQFAETGLGLKYRAHPLGVAMASVYLNRLPAMLDGKRANASRIGRLIRDTGWLEPLHPHVRGSHYAYPMLVIADDPARIREQIADRMHALGFLDFDIPGSTRSLSTFQAFLSPRSPVTEYRDTCVRRPVPLAEYLSQALVKIPVPVEQGTMAEDYLDTFAACLAQVGADLGLARSQRKSGIDRPRQHLAVAAALERARRDGIDQLVVGALAYRLRDGRPEVLLARRRPDEFLGGYEEVVGGGVEHGEELIDALHREVMEETGVAISAILGYHGTFDYSNEWGRRARQLNFTVQLASDQVHPDAQEHTSVRWIDRDGLDHAECTPEMKEVIRRWFSSWTAGLIG